MHTPKVPKKAYRGLLESALQLPLWQMLPPLVQLWPSQHEPHAHDAHVKESTL